MEEGEFEKEHSLDHAIQKINQRQREEVYAYLKGEYKSDEPFWWTPDRKDILLFWMLNKILELEQKIKQMEGDAYSLKPSVKWELPDELRKRLHEIYMNVDLNAKSKQQQLPSNGDGIQFIWEPKPKDE